jgi:hypothetical protein
LGTSKEGVALTRRAGSAATRQATRLSPQVCAKHVPAFKHVACAGVPHHGASARAAARHQLVRDLPGATEAAVVGACAAHALASLALQTSNVLGELASDGVRTVASSDISGRRCGDSVHGSPATAQSDPTCTGTPRHESSGTGHCNGSCTGCSSNPTIAPTTPHSTPAKGAGGPLALSPLRGGQEGGGEVAPPDGQTTHGGGNIDSTGNADPFRGQKASTASTSLNGFGQEQGR